MKRKTRAKVKGLWIKIEYADLSEECILGDCDPMKKLIRLDINLNDDEYNRVLKHEIMHMKLALSGLSEILDEKIEEAICVMMETD